MGLNFFLYSTIPAEIQKSIAPNRILTKPERGISNERIQPGWVILQQLRYRKPGFYIEVKEKE